MALAGRIDTHTHVVPPAYAKWMASRGETSGGYPFPSWSEEGALDMMQAAGIATAILSVSTPGVHFGDDAEARSMARDVNEFAADVAARRPDRFGFFATLTLPDVDGAVAEACHALDVLKADGVVLLTSVRGLYLGDKRIDPLMQELERRQAVVFVHPGEPLIEPLAGVPSSVCDFLLDTTRAAVNMAKAGWLERYPSLKIILSHAGGFVPYAAERIARACSDDGSQQPGLDRLRRFYFDTALSSSPYAMPCLLAFAGPTHVTYGSDWPHAPKPRGLHFTRLLDYFPLDERVRLGIDRQNAERLFPRLA